MLHVRRRVKNDEHLLERQSTSTGKHDKPHFSFVGLSYSSLQLAARRECKQACGMALILAYVILDMDSQTLLKCVRQ